MGKMSDELNNKGPLALGLVLLLFRIIALSVLRM